MRKEDEERYNKMSKKPSFFFSKTFATVVALVLQLAVIITILLIFRNHTLAFLVMEIIGIICCIFVVNDKSDPNYKITWLVGLVVLPLLGAVLYLLFANHKFTKKEMAKYAPVIKEVERGMNSKLIAPYKADIDIDTDPDAYNISKYIRKCSHVDIFKNTVTTYYPWGDDAFEPMLEALRRAKHYIFMEYFIITPGKFWKAILDILIEKARQGVDVRVIYDDLGCITTLHGKYYKYLRSQGIKCYKYAPIRPFLDIRMNNRDHRKILVVDGYIGFTGGINIADEYINEIVRFGKWKDNAIRFIGGGVYGLTTLFLATWVKLASKEDRGEVNYVEYLPDRYNPDIDQLKVRKGFVQPYGSVPFVYETVGANVYLDLLLRAKKYIYISTPYLILNDTLENAICQTAKNGVKVKLLTPHIPDKKMVFQLTRSYYKPLLEAGVEIYEFTPGFVHAKTFLVDGKMGTVGTINLDYRSLFLHSENGCFLYDCDCLKDIEADFDNTFLVSMPYTLEMYKQTKWYVKFLRALLRVFAPLM